VDPTASEAMFRAEVGQLTKLKMFKGGGLVIVSATYPDLIVELPHPSGARRRFRIRADNWNDIAPSVQPVDGDGNVIHGVPSGGYWTNLNSTWGFCVPGTREYHQHHGDNPWDQHRATTTLATVIGRLYTHYKASGG
jgi:hypothetical protein